MVTAISHVRRMRGGSQPQLMACGDHNLYVVKFTNNPQHRRVLCNEWIATRLAQHVGLPVADAALVRVDQPLIDRSQELSFQLSKGTVACQAGIHFGSKYVFPPLRWHLYDWIPRNAVSEIGNLPSFAGMLAFDKWLGNADGRQGVFLQRVRERSTSVVFIDHGYCFDAEHWTFRDGPLAGKYAWSEVYDGITGWKSFAPWLERIEQCSPIFIRNLQGEIPQNWLHGDEQELSALLERIIARRERVRSLITALARTCSDFFPNWSSQRNRQARPNVIGL